MEDDDAKKDKDEDSITVSPVNVHMFDFGLQEVLNKLMTSGIIRGAGTLVSLLLALIFGVMFLIGGLSLVKGKIGRESALETASVETNEEGTLETSENEAEQDIKGEEE